MPRFSERPLSQIAPTLRRKTLTFLLAIAVVVAAYGLLAPVLFRFLLPQYLDAVLLSQIYVFSELTAVTQLPMRLLEAKGAKRELYHIHLFNAGATIAVLSPLVLVYGVWGAVVARLLARGLVTANTFRVARRFVLTHREAQPS